MTDLHVRPTRAFADIVLNGDGSLEESYGAVLRVIDATGRFPGVLTSP